VAENFVTVVQIKLNVGDIVLKRLHGFYHLSAALSVSIS